MPTLLQRSPWLLVGALWLSLAPACNAPPDAPEPSTSQPVSSQPASPQAAPSQPAPSGRVSSRPVVLELLGDHAGKPMVIAVGGEVVFDGVWHLHPPGGFTDQLEVTAVDEALEVRITLEDEVVHSERHELDGKGFLVLLFQGREVEAFTKEATADQDG